MQTIQVKDIFNPINTGNSGMSTIRGGINTVVTFPAGLLTDKELEYVKLCARVDFFQVVRTATYMNEGLTFAQATTKYLTNKLKAYANK